MSKLIIDTEIIKDLLEYEWGYEGIREELDNLFLQNGIPLDKICAEIASYKDDKLIHAERNEMIDIVLEIIDKYRGDTDADI